MAPIKFEENLKEKLEQRTINPSVKSWETLATKLDAKEEKKGINKKLWFSIAASFIGGILIYNMLFISVGGNTIKENVVEVNNETKEIDRNINREEELIKKSETVETVEEAVEANKVEVKKYQVEQIKNTNYLVNTKTSKNKSKKVEEIKSNVIKNKSSKNNNNAYYALNNTLEKGIKVPSKVMLKESITANVSQEEIVEITDSELDALLKNAESKIVNTKHKNTIPLDYNELLQDVEDDLEETFRDKLLKTVKGGYRTVKTYVAERND